MKRIVVADAHRGSEWQTPEMAELADSRWRELLLLGERTGDPILDLGDNPEGLWRRYADLLADGRFMDEWRRYMALKPTLLIGNHSLEAPTYFPEGDWHNAVHLGNWWFEHGHQLDYNTAWQDKFYKLLPFLHRLTPWELAGANVDQYNAVIALIQMRAAMLARELGCNVGFGHTHAYLNAQYTREESFFIRTFNMPSITEDGQYGILDDGKLYLQRMGKSAARLTMRRRR